MARRRRMRPAKRDTSVIANRRLPSPIYFRAVRPVPVVDRRRYHPAPMYRPMLRSSGRVAVRRVVANRVSGRAKARPVFRSEHVFVAPRRVAICVRRKERREVLFASGRASRGVHSRKRRDEWSDVKCR